MFWFGAAGWTSYTQYNYISLLRWQYEIIYFRFRDVLKIPGNRAQDFVWANVYGSTLETTGLGAIFFMAFVLPRFMTKNPTGQIALGFIFFYFSGFAVELVVTTVVEFFRPRELEEGVQFAGFTIDFLQANRELLNVVDQEQRKGYSSIPFSEGNHNSTRQEPETYDW
ncbi:hypothetical protein NDI52_07320 [Leptolyngbya sp. PL-A3]|uniref:hypothetical protein n=1 Tax=Leptolyngbya sp. PL-A3 TaxID=2933911 RepID=UPI0032996F54